MSVLIKGMEMPTNCCQCPVNMEVCKRGYKYLLAHPELYDKRADNCPIVEIPPHGRLIDADALKTMWDNEVARLLEKGIEYLDYHVDTLFSDFKHDVDKMPTILEAEVET